MESRAGRRLLLKREEPTHRRPCWRVGEDHVVLEILTATAVDSSVQQPQEKFFFSCDEGKAFSWTLMHTTVVQNRNFLYTSIFN